MTESDIENKNVSMMTCRMDQRLAAVDNPKMLP